MKRSIHSVVSLPALLLAGCSDPMPELLVDREESTVAFHEPKRACITCHPQHVAEWSESNHAYAIVDPVFHAMVRLGQRQSGGKVGQFCVQCHTPIGMALGETPVYEEDGVFVQDFSSLSPAAKAGVTCDVCHTIEQVIEPRNARMVYTPNGTFRGPIQDPVETPAHKSAYSELHESSDLCGSCHNVVNPAGALIEETYDEWAASSYADNDETCQDCHMPTYEGQAATEGPSRTVHRHTFTGVDVSLVPEDEFPGYHETRQRAAELLQSAAEMRVETSPDGRTLTVELQNKTGHRLPSGATAERQMWLEVMLLTDDREEVFTSGTLDSQGDLRDTYDKHTLRPGSDPQLVVYRQIMLRDPAKDGNEGDLFAVDFPWQATEVDNTLLEPNAKATHTYDFSAVPPGTYQASVRLLFRTFPPYFLRILEEEAGLDPDVKTRVPTVAMQQSQWTITLTGDAVGEAPDGDCEDGFVLDCLDVCSPEEWLGDSFCDDSLEGDLYTANFDCFLFDFDDGDCLDDWTADTWHDWLDTGGGFDTPLCVDADDVLDCQDLCWPASWIGDGVCDDGTEYSWGSADFACAKFSWDQDDCESEAPVVVDDNPCEQPGWIEDCNLTCYPDYWLGDGVCDDGTEQDWGSPDFSCPDHDFDDGDCDTSPP